MQKAHQNSTFSCYFHEECQHVVWRVNLGLIFRLMASWWQLSFRTLFRSSTTLNWTVPAPWQQEWVHSIWIFISFQKKVLCCLLTRGTRFLISEWGISTQKSETYKSWFPWKPKLCQEAHFWTSFQKNLTWMDSEKGNRVFDRGHNVPPPLGLWSPKKPGCDRVKMVPGAAWQSVS